MNETFLHSILSRRLPAVTYAHSIVSLKDGVVMARELLTRFPGTDGAMRTVGDLLEDVTLSPELRVRLDLLCLGEVFDALARHPVPDHLLFVNLAPHTLQHPDFWSALEPWLWNLSIPPHRVVLEITEGFSRHDWPVLAEGARRLRSMGLRIAVDDLGSGSASLSHMARLGPDFIKVDKSLVRNAHRRPYQAALLNALAIFAQRMKVGYIAEGIETTQELRTVTEAGVPWGQGFIFGEPEPLVFPALAGTLA
jgi:EAL domain-containing protein (putative c-di-GMP-specific phosphodiesterase class I)